MARTRSQRRAASRERRMMAAHSPGSYLPAPAHMTENPNSAKRGAARLDVLDERGASRIAEARRAYNPLTVRTVITHAPSGRALPKRHHSESSYTI